MYLYLMFLTLLVSARAQPTPPGSIDYSCLHATTQQVNCDANQNPYYSVMTDVYDGQLTTQNPNYFTGNAYLYNAYDVPYYNHTVTKCDIDSLVSRPYRIYEEVMLFNVY